MAVLRVLSRHRQGTPRRGEYEGATTYLCQALPPTQTGPRSSPCKKYARTVAEIGDIWFPGAKLCRQHANMLRQWNSRIEWVEDS